ncbi:MAG: sigma 54-interacting transcriptional regulator [Eubacteriales bacterium]
MLCEIKIIADMNQKVWQEVKLCKERFIEFNENPINSPFMYPEIAESWIRSKKYGVDPYLKAFDKSRLNSKELQSLLKDKKELIDISVPFLKGFMSLLSFSNYRMYLSDENGIFIYEVDEQKRNMLGILMSEEQVGTTAHDLSLLLKKPVQLIGPYNYLKQLEDDISSAAPIMDENGEVLGTIVIVQSKTSKNLKNMQAHSLGWVTSMGVAIENEIKLKERNYYMGCLMDETLNSSFSLIEEGFILLNGKGEIIQINNFAASVLGISEKEIGGKPLAQFVDDYTVFAQVLKDGNPVYNYEFINDAGKKRVKYLLNIKPLSGGLDKNPIGILIRLSRSDKNIKLADTALGAEAKYTFDSILGQSQSIIIAKNIAKKIPPIPINVLLIGESGTGKEMFAQSIHNNYKPNAPFVAINCAALPKELIASELFGYEGGAFTGAERKGRVGKIELADGGTLFLDEIGDMPFEIQAVLLRVLEDKKVMRLGGNRYKSVNFRVIAATNKDLHKMVEQNKFREDLYYRLAIFKVKIPPLRERRNDIIQLVQYFMDDISQSIGCMIPELSKEVQNILINYNWPGNVRQLYNVVVYAVSTARDGVIRSENLPDEIFYRELDNSVNALSDKPRSLETLEEIAIKNTMDYTNNNIETAADILGIGKSTLYKKLKRYNV